MEAEGWVVVRPDIQDVDKKEAVIGELSGSKFCAAADAALL